MYIYIYICIFISYFIFRLFCYIFINIKYNIYACIKIKLQIISTIFRYIQKPTTTYIFTYIVVNYIIN